MKFGMASELTILKFFKLFYRRNIARLAKIINKITKKNEILKGGIKWKRASKNVQLQ